jgi:uncharacterized protein YndB with AHSA1/START domain
MTDATLETIDGRPALRFERTLAHSVERVWRAISDPAELERWFPAAADWTPATGESFEAYGATGEVTEVDAPHRLAWTFGGERYSFELAAQESGCRLVFTHVFDDRARAAQTAAGWEAYISRLEPHLAGGYLSEEEPHEPWEEVMNATPSALGSTPVRAGASWRLSVPVSDDAISSSSSVGPFRCSSRRDQAARVTRATRGLLQRSRTCLPTSESAAASARP